MTSQKTLVQFQHIDESGCASKNPFVQARVIDTSPVLQGQAIDTSHFAWLQAIFLKPPKPKTDWFLGILRETHNSVGSVSRRCCHRPQGCSHCKVLRTQGMASLNYLCLHSRLRFREADASENQGFSLGYRNPQMTKRCLSWWVRYGDEFWVGIIGNDLQRMKIKQRAKKWKISKLQWTRLSNGKNLEDDVEVHRSPIYIHANTAFTDAFFDFQSLKDTTYEDQAVAAR
ncbi:hypothetical protein B0H13DRAFT_1928798 [Mycena leptocephala]|nr:hypothetical protein B0H13DRAFT_1928798 [Mycena leptocephala]